MSRQVATGTFELAMPAAEAIDYFTPEGERSWAPGWDPYYPDGEASETPGTVFTTDAGHGVTVWVIQEIDRTACTASYTRVTPGLHAGTVRVRCLDRAHRCIVEVTYDMTMLPGAGPAALDAYRREPFDSMLRDWATAVEEAAERS